MLPLQLVRRGLLVRGVGVVEGRVRVEHVADRPVEDGLRNREAKRLPRRELPLPDLGPDSIQSQKLSRKLSPKVSQKTLQKSEL